MESFHSVKRKKCVIIYGCEMVCLLFYVDCDVNKMSYSILLFIISQKKNVDVIKIMKLIVESHRFESKITIDTHPIE